MVSELHGLLSRGIINLNPAYQRESVVSFFLSLRENSCSTSFLRPFANYFSRFQWQRERAEELIDSIFRSVHVPELLFNVYTPPPTTTTTTTDEQHEIDKASHASNPDLYTVARARRKKRQPNELERGGRFIWNCADGKQRCTSIKRSLSLSFSLFVSARLLTRGEISRKKIRFLDGEIGVVSFVLPCVLPSTEFFDSDSRKYPSET